MPKFKAINGPFYNFLELEKLNGVEGGASTAVAGVTVADSASTVQSITLSLNDVAIAMTDAGAAGSHGTALVAEFPVDVTVLGSVVDLTVSRVGTAITTTAAVVASVGTAAVGVDNATLTAAEADVVASTAATLTAGAGAAVVTTNSYKVVTAAQGLNLNFAIPDAGSSGDDVLTVNGTITVSYIPA